MMPVLNTKVLPHPSREGRGTYGLTPEEPELFKLWGLSGMFSIALSASPNALCINTGSAAGLHHRR